jgi:hypothetical protein
MPETSHVAEFLSRPLLALIDALARDIRLRQTI